MAKKGKKKKAYSTCLEDGPIAEMMQKMMGKQGVGSLCSEMMKAVMEKKGAAGNFTCAELMESLAKQHDSQKQETKTSKKEDDHVGNK